MSEKSYEQDRIETGRGEVAITFLGHGTLQFSFQNKTVHVDPIDRVADYRDMPAADIIFITHHHRDHLDPGSVRHILKGGTEIVLTAMCADQLRRELKRELEEKSVRLHVMKNGDTLEVQGLAVSAVPAYNRVHMREENVPFHIKGEGNGYLMRFGEKRVYVAGDTENIPEMEKLPDIAVAFLPVNLPYTMTPGMAVEAARVIRPDILYPYHFGDTDTERLVELLRDTGIDVRIRSMA